MIPNRLTLICLFMPLPDYAAANLQAWTRVCPGLDIRIITAPEQVPEKRRNLFNRADTIGEKCDIARLALIERDGGLYADLDITPYRDVRQDWTAGAKEVWGTVPTCADLSQAAPDNAFFGAEAGSRFIGFALDTIKLGPRTGELAALMTTGTYHLQDTARRYLRAETPYTVDDTKEAGGIVFLPTRAFGCNNYPELKGLSGPQLMSGFPEFRGWHDTVGSWY